MLASALIRHLIDAVKAHGDLEVTLEDNRAPAFRQPVDSVVAHMVKRGKPTFGGSGSFFQPSHIDRCNDRALKAQLLAEPAVKVIVIR